jgi:hypothetical protein
VTVDDFRRLALSFPEAAEQSHMGHPDFRVRGKIFATLGHPSAEWGALKLTPTQQQLVVQMEPTVFEPVPGGWGAMGATRVRIRAANKSTLREVLSDAWRNVAPKSLLTRLDA